MAQKNTNHRMPFTALDCADMPLPLECDLVTPFAVVLVYADYFRELFACLPYTVYMIAREFVRDCTSLRIFVC